MKTKHQLTEDLDLKDRVFKIKKGTKITLEKLENNDLHFLEIENIPGSFQLSKSEYKAVSDVISEVEEDDHKLENQQRVIEKSTGRVAIILERFKFGNEFFYLIQFISPSDERKVVSTHEITWI